MSSCISNRSTGRSSEISARSFSRRRDTGADLGRGSASSLASPSPLPLSRKRFVAKPATCEALAKAGLVVLSDDECSTVAFTAAVGEDTVSLDGLCQRWGEPDVEILKVFLNSASSEILVDLEATFTLADRYRVSVGGENVFDTEPDPEQDFVLRILGVDKALTSPFGFNGGFWYVRASVEL